jgi:hypothetical protein
MEERASPFFLFFSYVGIGRYVTILFYCIDKLMHTKQYSLDFARSCF